MSARNAVNPLGVPVLSVEEQIFDLPPAGHQVSNRARKLLFVFEADCRHRIHELGEGSTIELEAGDVLILPHVCRQDYLNSRGATARVHAMRLLIDPEIVPPLIPGRAMKAAFAEPFGEESVEAFASTHFDRLIHLKGGVTPEVREALARLRRESEGSAGGRAFGYRYRVGAVCLELMVLVARQLENTVSPRAAIFTQGGFRAEEVREFVIKHLDTPLRLETIATHVSLSPEHLSRVWKKATGTTIFEYVRRSRIERAKTLLTSSDLNISQISLACGFSSLALFSRTFKEETGVSPVGYRERLASSANAPTSGARNEFLR